MTYTLPATERITWGDDAVGSLGTELERLGASRVLVLVTRSLAGSRAEARLLAAVGDRAAAVSYGTSQHVPSSAVDGLIAEARATAPDAVVTLGGGSVTDAAKALAAALADGCEDSVALRRRRIVFEYPDSLEVPALSGDPIPIVAAPTTLSAAEYDGLFGMTHQGVKDLYGDPRLTPRSIVLDPGLTHETPQELWRASGIRALDHAVEIYLSKAPTPLTDGAALHAVRLLRDHLGRDDDASRLACLQAAWLSMVGVDNVTLGLSHGIGHQVGARCGVPHGITSCVMLPAVLERMVEVMPQRLSDIAVALTPFEAAERPRPSRVPELVRSFIEGLGLPTRLSQVGVTPADYDAIAQDAMRDFVVAFSPIAVDEPTIRALLERAA